MNIKKNTAIEQIELYLKHLYGYDPVKRTLHLKLADICHNYLNIWQFIFPEQNCKVLEAGEHKLFGQMVVQDLSSAYWGNQDARQT